eukprot:138781-Chlamydomonas_euryale.AAC.1
MQQRRRPPPVLRTRLSSLGTAFPQRSGRTARCTIPRGPFQDAGALATLPRPSAQTSTPAPPQTREQTCATVPQMPSRACTAANGPATRAPRE